MLLDELNKLEVVKKRLNFKLKGKFITYYLYQNIPLSICIQKHIIK